MQYYNYRIDRKCIGAICSRTLAVLLWEKELSIFKYLTLEVLVDFVLKSHELLLLWIKITKSWGTQSFKMQQTCIMNACNERESDSENFGERITEFEVTVAKKWRK
jgi:hypothetical protein